jgi:hypothetical protein
MSGDKGHRMAVLLELMRVDLEGDTLDQLHTAVEQGIALTSQRIKQATRSGDQEYLDAVTDDECVRIEELLGLAFVVAQTFITSVRSRIAALSDGCKHEFGRPLSFIGDPKAYGALKIGDTMPGGSVYTEIETINAVANYWKHQEDWPTHLEKKDDYCKIAWDTARMRDNEKRTVKIVVGIGMSPSFTGNLRAAARAFGVASYEDLSLVREKLRRWADSLYEKARLEMSQLQQM